MVLSCFSEEEEKKKNLINFFSFFFASFLTRRYHHIFFLLLTRNEKNLILDQRSEEILGPKTDQNKKIKAQSLESPSWGPLNWWQEGPRVPESLEPCQKVMTETHGTYYIDIVFISLAQSVHFPEKDKMTFLLKNSFICLKIPTVHSAGFKRDSHLKLRFNVFLIIFCSV